MPIESDIHHGFIKQRLPRENTKSSNQLCDARDKLVSAFNSSYESLIEHSKGLPKDFDPDIYLNLHQDVKDGGMDPVKHFIHYGLAEGRKYK